MTRLGYRQIAQTLDVRIRRGDLSPGDQLPTELQLAEQFQVNRFTVRRALATLERQGKLSRHRGRGTFVAQPQQRGLSWLYVGQLESHFNKDQFLALVAEGQARGHRVYGLEPTDENNTPEQRAVLASRIGDVNWVVVNNAYYPRIASALEAAQTKLIIIGHATAQCERPHYAVLIDRFTATRLAFEHLVQLGHRRLALVTVGHGPDPHTDPPRITNEAFLGFQDAAMSFGFTESCHTVRVPNSEKDKDIFRTLLGKAAIAHRRPTGIICDGDFRARRLYEVAAELNLRIGADLSVIGQGDTPWCEAMSPELSSVNFGEKHVARLVMALGESGAPTACMTCRVAPQLVARHSCAPPPARPTP